MTDNVFVITADSIRADHCGWHDKPVVSGLTPNLDSLAAEAITFETAIAPGPRTPSSIPVSHTGVPFSYESDDAAGYDDRTAKIQDHLNRFETISEWLRAEGYTTIAFTANPWTTVETGFDTGFETFVEVGKTGGSIRSIFGDTRFRSVAKRFDQWIHKDSYFSQWRTFYDDLLAAIERADDPVFLWAFLLDAHNPYLVPRQDREETSAISMWSAMFRANNMPGHKTRERTARKAAGSEATREQIKGAYRDCVRSVDTFVGRLLDDTEDATVLFHSDHGEAFGEHGSYGHEQVLYEENIHVPCLLYDGSTMETVTHPVSTVSIPDMIKAVVTETALHPDTWTTEYAVARPIEENAIALRGDRWKYIRTDDGEELYDLVSDPDERNDRSESEPAVLEECRNRCETYVDSLPEYTGGAEGVADERMKEHLESLGYLE